MKLVRIALLIAVFCAVGWPTGRTDGAPAHRDSLTQQLSSLLTTVKTLDNTPGLESHLNLVSRLIEQSTTPQHKLFAYQVRQQIIFRLARIAQLSNNPRDLAFHVSTLRTTSILIRQHNTPDAPIIADYWLLQADLFNINTSPVTIPARQKLLVDRLDQFLTIWPPNQAQPGTRQHRIIRSVQSALLRLLDRQGDTTRILSLLPQVLIAYRDNPAITRNLRLAFAYTTEINKPIPLINPSTRRPLLPTSNPPAKLTLIHFYADWFPPSTSSIPRLTEFHEKYTSKGLALYSVNLSSSNTTNQPHFSWSTLHNSAVAKDLAAQLDVVTIPRYLFIDREGHLLTSSADLSIFDQIAAKLDEQPVLNEAIHSGGRKGGKPVLTTQKTSPE